MLGTAKIDKHLKVLKTKTLFKLTGKGGFTAFQRAISPFYQFTVIIWVSSRHLIYCLVTIVNNMVYTWNMLRLDLKCFSPQTQKWYQCESDGCIN